MIEETWNPIPSLGGEYFASSIGRIARVSDWKLLSFYMNDGYLYVQAGDKRLRAHRLIAEAFLGPCPDGLQVCHINCVKHDNRIENLKYGTPSENALDSFRDRMRRLGYPEPTPLPAGAIRSVTLYERAPGVWRVRKEIAGEERKFATETIRGTRADAERRRLEILGNGPAIYP